jgi:aldose 1-epimerase
MQIEKFMEEGENLLRLVSDSGLAVTLSPLGAGIYEIRYLGAPMTVAAKSPANYVKSTAYYGKTVGRIAGRIPSAHFTFEGKEIKTIANEGVNTLHGGPAGLSFHLFKYEIGELDGKTIADFFYDSPEGEGGFPGEVRFNVRYLLGDKEPTLRIEYRYLASEDTPINLTSHTYFNLGADENVENQTLMVRANEVEHYTNVLVPLGLEKVCPALDFRKPKKIGQDIMNPYLHETRTNGYDHCYKFTEGEEEEAPVRLESEKYSLEIATSYPAIQVYSSNWPTENLLLTNGRFDGLHSAIALEAVYVPGDFTSMKAPKGQLVKNFIEFRFSKKEKQ